MFEFLITKLYTALEKPPESKEVRTCRSLKKNYSSHIYEEDFPNYQNFENINDAYSNSIQEVMVVINLVAPIKSRRIKQNSQE